MLSRVKTTNRSLTRSLTRRTNRPTALLAGGLLAASMTLAGCSGSGTEAYCDALAETKADLDGLDEGDAGALDAAFDAFEELGDKAPVEVEEDWEVVLDDVHEVEDVLEEAGLDFEDLDAMSSGEMPDDLDLEKLEELGTAMEGLGGEEFDDAMEAIEEHADEECGIDLNE